MLCETCHTKEATVHIASIMHAPANMDARHFCEPCGQAAQTANPVLSITARNLPPVYFKPVTGIATPARVKIASVEQQLAELDPIWETFCARREYQFKPGRELWPNRGALKNGKIDHKLALTMDIRFIEMLDKGFFPGMPWSLYAMAAIPFYEDASRKRSQAASLPPFSLRPILTFELFRRRPFSELPETLEKELERAFLMLSEVTREDVLQKGQVPQGKLGPLRLYPW